MKFENVELLPGVVTSAADPLKIGRVKAVAPTLFPDNASAEALPWVNPLNMGGFQRHSTLCEGSKIWIFKTKDNYEEFWYIPMVEYTEATKQYLSDYTNAEVVFLRDKGTNTAALIYNDSDGIKMLMGSVAEISINNNGEIRCRSNSGNVQIKNNAVYCGSESPANHVMMGEPLQEALYEFAEQLSNIGSMWHCPYSGECGNTLRDAANNFKDKISKDNIVCKNTLAD